MQNSSTVNIFIVATPLQSLSAESVAYNFEKTAKNCLFYTKPDLLKLIKKERWHSTVDLFSPKLHSGKKGVLRNIKLLTGNLKTVSEACAAGAEIRLHAAQIFRPEQNFLINYLRRKHPNARIHVRIIPDGLLNVSRNPYKQRTVFKKYYKKLLGLFFPDLNYHVFQGDRTGADDPVVDTVYVLPGFPHEYSSEKVVRLPSLVSSVKEGKDLKDIALVIGQPLFGIGLMSERDMESVTQGISRYLNNEGFYKIIYKGHPIDKKKEFKDHGYEELIIEETLEEHLSCNHYGMVIGVCSSALLTAKTIVSDGTRVVSYGLNKCSFVNDAQKNKVLNPFRILSVELVED